MVPKGNIEQTAMLVSSFLHNDSSKAGSEATARRTFGGGRFALYAVHTRFEEVQWFIEDASAVRARDSIIFQGDLCGAIRRMRHLGFVL